MPYKKKVYVFDLDDTIYPELDFRRSAFYEITELLFNLYELDKDETSEIFKKEEDAFGKIAERLEIPSLKESLIWYYRLHTPKLSKYKSIKIINRISKKGSKVIILTDGHSITQRKKLYELGLLNFELYISEEFNSKKPNSLRFKLIQNKNPNAKFFYIADNPSKDFYAPNKLGWTTIMIRQKWHTVHGQDLKKNKNFNPKKIISSIVEILNI